MAAEARWRVWWDFDWVRCDGSGLVMGLDVYYAMPSWMRPASAPPEVADAWEQYERALWCHEYGHTQFGVDLLNESYEALSNLATPFGCTDLRLRAEQAFQPIYERHIAEEIAYDEATNHGATMGARLCPDEDRTGCN
jgi:predicted secreted Zn-dependent protease